MEQDTQVQEQAQEQAQISLTLQDLRVLAGSVELGAQRGAFRAGEMEVIGSTYNKLALFLKANDPQTPAETAPAETAPAETESEEVTE